MPGYPSDLPQPCPVCGAYSIAPDIQISSLLAVCDVLVIKALEKMGRWICRSERPRFRALGTRPWYVAHTLWPPSEAEARQTLKGAWDVVPALLDVHGCGSVTSAQVVDMLNSYTLDLIITGTMHSIYELAWRFEDRLGLPVYLSPATTIYPAVSETAGPLVQIRP